MSLDINGEKAKELLKMYYTVGNQEKKCEGLREVFREEVTQRWVPISFLINTSTCQQYVNERDSYGHFKLRNARDFILYMLIK